ncbi:UDP-N-acetylmuramoyl-L-alanine--D-glutamate ligase [Luteithermobacter gelatinilyticus]|uniref:UDP-N-acetylmuramoyl-L-alanine--D-glutamate ligase n=1 Tax=Luteithermobacter gelatinilyticus TaxID=2582913 RepID=UPI0011062123|nr:UDP-N-acetylmuramoyl-L-alanine--D-glutamate ligase [Luteithermobacter gelatinilyticus]
MTISELDKARIAIWGLGREGMSAYRFLRRCYPAKRLILVDRSPPKAALMATDSRLDFVPEEKLSTLGDQIDVVIKSPGISLYRDDIAQLERQGVRVSSCTNLWFALDKPGKIIAITGSNGKSTTSSLLHHILCTLGHKALLGGNIGRPLLDLMEEPDARDAEYWVLELSSYQTADLKGRPDLAVLLNLFPEHIQWHGTHETYYRDKMNLLRDDTVPALLNHKDALTRRYLAERKRVTWFNHPEGLHCRSGQLYHGDRILGETDSFPLSGAHNRENLCAALAVCEVLGLDPKAAFRAALDFRGLPHRLEPLGRLGRHYFYNDSIATTPEATMAALNALDRPDMCLIAGGQDRQQDYRHLARLITERNLHAVITVYETGDRLYDCLKTQKYHGKLEKVLSLEQAVRRAVELTPAEGVILLSPAAPSYDAFRNYEQRGDMFREAAKNVIGKTH